MNEKMFLYIPVRLIKKGCITFGLILFFSLLFKGFNLFEKKNHFKIVKSEWIEKEKNTLHSTNIDRFAEYRIQKGDTLQKISKKLYGNGNMVQPIVRLNRITDEKALKLGSTLKVPRSGLIASIKIED